MARTFRKEREIDNTKQEILRAAARAAAAHGFETITLRDIAKETGYTVGTLYSYFDGKDAILEGLVTEIVAVGLQTLKEPMPAGLTLAQKMELLVQRQLKFAEEWRDAVFVLLAVMFQGGPAFRSFRFNADAHFCEGYAKWLKANATSAELDNQDPTEIALVYFGVLQAVITATLLRKSKQPLVSLAPRIMQYLSGGIRAFVR